MQPPAPSPEALAAELAEVRQRLAALEDAQHRHAEMESQVRFQAQLLDSVRESVIAADLDGRVVYWGRGAEALYGYRREEVLGKSITFIIQSHEAAEEEGRMQHVRQHGSWSGQYVQRRKDGTAFWADTFISLVTDADGNACALVGIDRDITAQKRAEEALQESHAGLQHEVDERASALTASDARLRAATREQARADAWFRQLLESSPDAVVVTGDDGRIVLVNREAERLTGFRREEMLGQPVEMLIPENLRGRHAKHRAHYGRNPYVRQMSSGLELACLCKDGSQFPAEISLGPLKVEGQLYVFCAIRDVTARKEAERALRESEERFDLAVRGTDAGIWDWDLRTNKVFFSSRWKAILGYGDGEVGNEFSEWERRVHPDEREQALAAVREYLDGKRKDFELEHRLRHKDGSYRWILSRGAAVCDENGRPYRIVGSQIDITRRRDAEKSLREREAQLRVAQRIQEHLWPNQAPELPGFDVAGASHPAEFTAGDHYDFLAMPPHGLGLVVGDVSGHGFGPALLMASLCARMRSLAETGLEIDEILARTNQALAREVEEGQFITAILARIDTQTASLTYTNAGHPPGYVLDTAGAVKARLESTSFPLGILPDVDFPAAPPVALEPGDVVVLLTDGVLEAASPEDQLFGMDRVLDVVRRNLDRPAAEIIDAVHRAVQEFSRRAQLADDFTCLVVKVHPMPASPNRAR